MEAQYEAAMEADEQRLEHILECYPDLDMYKIPIKLWDVIECPECNLLFNTKKLTQDILFCDNCDKEIIPKIEPLPDLDGNDLDLPF